MAFTEDMAAFFSTDEFAVQAVITKADSTVLTVKVIFNTVTEELWGSENLSDEYTITVATNDVPGVRSGDAVVIDGVNYKIRFIQLVSDGYLKKAKLARM